MPISAGNENNLSSLDFDYFDPNASFTISSLTAGGIIKFNGKTVSSDEKFTFNELNDALDKISFVGEEGQTSGSALITITDVDRGNSGNETLKYEIHNKPIISYEEIANTYTAGEFGKISGIKLYDVDFDDKDKDGIKDPDELRQILKVELNSNGGKIKLTDPNSNPNNQIKVTVDVSR